MDLLSIAVRMTQLSELNVSGCWRVTELGVSHAEATISSLGHLVGRDFLLHAYDLDVDDGDDYDEYDTDMEIDWEVRVEDPDFLML